MLTVLITLVIVVLILWALFRSKKANQQAARELARQNKRAEAAEDPINILKKEILLETDPAREAALKKKLKAFQAEKSKNKSKGCLIGLGVILGIFFIAIIGSNSKKNSNPTEVAPKETPTPTEAQAQLASTSEAKSQAQPTAQPELGAVVVWLSPFHAHTTSHFFGQKLQDGA